MPAPKKKAAVNKPIDSYTETLINGLNSAATALEGKYICAWKKEQNPITREEIHLKFSVLDDLVKMLSNQLRNNK